MNPPPIAAIRVGSYDVGFAEMVMVKRIHEVWEEPNSVTMFVKGSGGRKLLGPEARLLRTFEAESVDEAFATHYRLMGWKEWKPIDGVPDTPYTDTDPPLEDEPE